MEKYVRLMADHCSSGVWDKDGCNIDLDSLPIHQWLKSMIIDWQRVFDREALEDSFDVDTFSKNGYALAVKLKQNLPDWEVVYFDEAASWHNKPRSEYYKKIT